MFKTFSMPVTNDSIQFSTNGTEAKSQLLERGLAVQELISNRPGFLIRWGVTIFLLILILIIAATWFIQYPDTVVTNARLTSLNPPKPVIARSEGQLVQLFSKEGDRVEKNQAIGFIESTASPEFIQRFLPAQKSDAGKRYVNVVET